MSFPAEPLAYFDDKIPLTEEEESSFARDEGAAFNKFQASRDPAEIEEDFRQAAITDIEEAARKLGAHVAEKTSNKLSAHLANPLAKWLNTRPEKYHSAEMKELAADESVYRILSGLAERLIRELPQSLEFHSRMRKRK